LRRLGQPGMQACGPQGWPRAVMLAEDVPAECGNCARVGTGTAPARRGAHGTEHGAVARQEETRGSLRAEGRGWPQERSRCPGWGSLDEKCSAIASWTGQGVVLLGPKPARLKQLGPSLFQIGRPPTNCRCPAAPLGSAVRNESPLLRWAPSACRALPHSAPTDAAVSRHGTCAFRIGPLQ
jgi:hypothetical protein